MRHGILACNSIVFQLKDDTYLEKNFLYAFWFLLQFLTSVRISQAVVGIRVHNIPCSFGWLGYDPIGSILNKKKTILVKKKMDLPLIVYRPMAFGNPWYCM